MKLYSLMARTSALAALYLVGALTGASSIYAAPPIELGPLLEPGQTLVPKALLEFTDEPGHYFFIGENPGQGHHVFEIINHVSIERRIQSRSMVYYDGGSLELYLEDDARLAVPAEHSRRFMINEHAGPSVTYASRPRELLSRVVMTRQIFKSLHLLDIIFPKYFTPDTPNTVPASPRNTSVYLQNQDEALLLRVVVNSKADDDRHALSSCYDVEKKLEELFKNIDPRKIKLLKESGSMIPLYVGSFLVAVDPGLKKNILKAIKKIDGTTTEVIEQLHNNSSFDHELILEDKDPVNIPALAAALNTTGSPIAFKLNALTQINPDRLALSNLSEKEKFALTMSLVHTLSDLEHVLSPVLALALEQLRHEVIVPNGTQYSDSIFGHYNYLSQVALTQVSHHPYYAHFVRPLRKAIDHALDVLHAVGTVESARAVLEHAHIAQNTGVRLMGQAVSHAGGNYTDVWLGWLTDAINEANALTPEVIVATEMGTSQEWRYSTHSGGIYESLGASGNESFWHLSENSVVGYKDLARELPSTPLVLLGLTPDARVEKKKIIQFLITSDTTAAAQIDLVNKSSNELGRRNTLITGNSLLTSVFGNLAHAAHKFYDYPQFSKNNYYRNVLDIFIELVETSHITLHTQGTYHALLNASLRLIQELDSSEDAGIAERVLLLRKVIQTKLVGLFRFASPRPYSKDKGCEILLTPRPYEVWRRQW